MPAAYKRVYVDLPADVHAELKMLAQEARVSAKKYLTDLILHATAAHANVANTNRSKRKK